MTGRFVRLLGRAEVERHDRRTKLPPGQVTRFLAYLACRNDWVGREELSFLFWPDRPNEVARRNLRKLLHRARNTAADLETEGEFVRWIVATDVRSWRDAVINRNWAEAFRLYRGPLLDEPDGGETAEFTHWLEQERERMRREWRDALVIHADEMRPTDPDRAGRLLRRYLDVDPFDEGVLQAHLRCLAAAGQHDELGAAYRDFAQRLASDLGLEPSETTRALLTDLVAEGERDPARPRGSTAQHRPAPPVAPPALDTTGFVGRERELERLREHLTRALTGRGGAVAVEGEVGIGKTRLVGEFLRRTDGIQIFSGRCFERELTAPLEPIRSALTGLAQLDLPGTIEGERFWTANPSDRSAIHQGLTARLVQTARRNRGTILFIDDLQWSDAATLEFLSYAAKRVHGEPILIVASYRREDRSVLSNWLAHLAERRAVTVIQLERLAPDQIHALLWERALVPTDDLRWLSEFVYRESEGNPFYVVEYLRWLRDSGVLELDESQRIVALRRQQLRAVALPESVRALVWARYQALGLAEREVLNLAAVLGRTFALELLEEVATRDPIALWSDLEPLLESGLITEVVNGQYAFSHDKLRQTIYDGIGPPMRRALHGRIGAALARLGAGEAELAHHFLRAHEWSTAFAYLEVAAQEAERNHAWETALQVNARALEIVDRLPEADLKRFSLLQARERLLEYMERQPEWFATVEQMAALAERLDRPRLRAEAQLKRMAALLQKGERAEANEARQEAIALFSRLGDTDAEARVHRERAYSAWTSGDYREVLEASLEALQLYQVLGNRRAEAATSGNIAQAYRRLEQHEKALVWAEAAAAIYGELDDELGEYLRLDTLSWIHIQRGDTEAAAELLEQILPIARRLGDKHLLVEKHMNLGQFYLGAGESERALQHFRAGAQLGAEIGDPRHEGYPLMSAGATLQRLGESEAAAQAYRRAARLLATAHAVSGMPAEQIAQADALTLLAGALPHSGSGSAGRLDAFETAEAIFRHHGERLRLSKLLMDRGGFYWRSGEFTRAATDYEEALASARQAGSQARVTAAMASLGVVYRELGRLHESIEAHLAALAQLERFEDRRAEAYVLTSLAGSYRLAQRNSDARSCLERSLALRRDLGDLAGETEALRELAELDTTTSR